MKKLTVGILAHVDAGKTTLSEALLYLSGQTRKLGRVDHQDTVLDTDEQDHLLQAGPADLGPAGADFAGYPRPCGFFR